MKTPFIVGLTGGIGSGKSTVSGLFAQHHIPIIDADQASRIVVEPYRPALQKISKYFGSKVIDSNGQLNRSALRNIIFNSSEQRIWLENLLHPLIAEEIQRQLSQAQGPYIILMSPLLLESGQAKYVHRVLVIDVPEAVQLERTQQRDQVTQEQIQAIMQSQWTRAQRLEKADEVIENINSIEELEKQVEQLHRRYLTLAKTN